LGGGRKEREGRGKEGLWPGSNQCSLSKELKVKMEI